MELKYDLSFKIIVLGNSGVGKSNIIERLRTGKDYQPKNISTFGKNITKALILSIYIVHIKMNVSNSQCGIPQVNLIFNIK